MGMGRIRWVKIKKIISQIMGYNIELIVITALERDIKGIIYQSENRYEILLNALYAKDEKNVVEIIAHELAHIKYPRQHGRKFEEERKRILQKIKDKLEGGESDEVKNN